MKREFVDLKTIYPPITLEVDNYFIYRQNISDDEIQVIKNSNNIGSLYLDRFVVGEEHIILLNKTGEGVMMSDHPSETITNQDFINKATGDVLIFGLGLGLIVFPLLNADDITSITIVEMDPDLPRLVGDLISVHDKKGKVKIESGDAFTFYKTMDQNKKYDTIYFDIWAKINTNSFKEMNELQELYKQFKKEDDSYINSWCYDHKDKIKQ